MNRREAIPVLQREAYYAARTAREHLLYAIGCRMRGAAREAFDAERRAGFYQAMSAERYALARQLMGIDDEQGS